MIQLDKALRVWKTPEFEVILKQEIAHLGADQLPLQQGLAISSTVTADPITVIIQRVTEFENVLRVKVGILYKGLIGGCSCADDPTPLNENNEYCVVQLDIDKQTAMTRVVLVTE
jgi:hypothetical protein